VYLTVIDEVNRQEIGCQPNRREGKTDQ